MGIETPIRYPGLIERDSWVFYTIDLLKIPSQPCRKQIISLLLRSLKTDYHEKKSPFFDSLTLMFNWYLPIGAVLCSYQWIGGMVAI